MKSSCEFESMHECMNVKKLWTDTCQRQTKRHCLVKGSDKRHINLAKSSQKKSALFSGLCINFPVSPLGGWCVWWVDIYYIYIYKKYSKHLLVAKGKASYKRSSWTLRSFKWLLLQKTLSKEVVDDGLLCPFWVSQFGQFIAWISLGNSD